jgi:hypothetical protein
MADFKKLFRVYLEGPRKTPRKVINKKSPSPGRHSKPKLSDTDNASKVWCEKTVDRLLASLLAFLKETN